MFQLERISASKSRIADLCDRFGSDKDGRRVDRFSWPLHNYAEIYELIFNPIKESTKLVVECGIGTTDPDKPSTMGAEGSPGASLRVWKDYFPNARVCGFDIDDTILFQEERIETYHCDQRESSSVRAAFSHASIVSRSIDVFIDDGLHTFDAGIALLDIAHLYVRRGGLYIIEDVMPEDIEKYRRFFASWTAPFEGASIGCGYRAGQPVWDNSLIVIGI